MLWLCRDLFIDWYHFSIYINIYKPGCQNRMLTYMQIFRHLISGTNVYFIRRRGWVSSRASSFLLIIAHFLSSGSTNYIQKERFVASQLELNITHNFVSLLIFACNYLVKPNMVANWGVSRLVSCVSAGARTFSIIFIQRVERRGVKYRQLVFVTIFFIKKY